MHGKGKGAEAAAKAGKANSKASSPKAKSSPKARKSPQGQDRLRERRR